MCVKQLVLVEQPPPLLQAEHSAPSLALDGNQGSEEAP